MTGSGTSTGSKRGHCVPWGGAAGNCSELLRAAQGCLELPRNYQDFLGSTPGHFCSSLGMNAGIYDIFDHGRQTNRRVPHVHNDMICSYMLRYGQIYSNQLRYVFNTI